MYLASQIIPSLLIVKTLRNTDNFLEWMKETHPQVETDDLFQGYKFCIECCLHSFYDGIANDQVLEIENDFLLNRALSESVPLYQISNTCEKTIILKNLKPHVKSVLRARKFESLSQRCLDFENQVTIKFEDIFRKNLSISSAISLDKETALKLTLLDFAHTFLLQIKNNGPLALMLNPINLKYITDKRKEICFEGYKYTIQYLLKQLLGEKVFNNSNMVNIHLSDSWRDYKYIDEQKSDDFLENLYNRRFNLSEQTCLDSYFYRLKDEVTTPLSEKYEFPIFQIDLYYHFDSSNYSKKDVFGNLISSSDTTDAKQKIKTEDQINKILYWYPFETVNAWLSQMHLGIPSFNTMLAGTVALFKPKVSETAKVVVAKFTHPWKKDNTKNDYSYGILVDTKSSAGHYSSGWIIYQNACGDYSGFSGSEFQSSERLISKYIKQNKIELRELIISLAEFKNFTRKFDSKIEEEKSTPNEILKKEIIQFSRSKILEYFTYHVFSNSKPFKNYKVSMNVDQNSRERKNNDKEKDIVIENEKEVILIECKLNLNNYNIKKVIKNLWGKVNKYDQERKSCQIWSWYDISDKNKRILDRLERTNTPVSYIEVQSDQNVIPLLKSVNLQDLKYIMQDCGIH